MKFNTMAAAICQLLNGEVACDAWIQIRKADDQAS